ncbi:MAG TPA: hypothetical protein VNL77_23845 [Roseiflexaceae bacterium]|nr:hypothetical protein [Roseiflexaceae bacterium]
MEEQAHPIHLLAWSSDGALLASGLAERVALRSPESAEVLRTLESTGGWISALAWGSAGLAAGTREGTVQVWDAASGAPRVLGRHAQTVSALAWRTGAPLLASGDTGGQVRIWESASGGVVATLTPTGQAVLGLAWLGPDRLLAVERGGQLWLCERSRCTLVLPEVQRAAALAVSARYGLLAVGSGDGTIFIRRVAVVP